MLKNTNTSGAPMTLNLSDFHFPHILLIWWSSPASQGKLRFEKRLLDFQEKTAFKEQQLLKRLLGCVGLIDIQQGAHLAGANIRLAWEERPKLSHHLCTMRGPH